MLDRVIRSECHTWCFRALAWAVPGMNFRHMCVLYVFIASSYAASEVEDDEGVLILNENNFEDVVAKSKLLLVKFCKYVEQSW